MTWSKHLGALVGLLALLLVAACSFRLPGPAGSSTLPPSQPAGQAGGEPGQAEEGLAEATSLNLVAAENGGAIVFVSDEMAKYPARNLIDGYKLDFGEWWTHEPPEFPQVVVFALSGGTSHTIDRVVLNPWTSEWRYAWVKDFELYVSADSPDLEDMGWVGSFRLDHYGIDQTFRFEPVQARYIALVLTSHYGSEEGITLNEFEVYAAPPGSVAVEPALPSGIGNLVAAGNGGCIVDYSSEDSSDWGVEHLIDGSKDTDTGWSSSEDLDEVQYVVFAFPNDEIYRVNRVVLNPYSDGYEEDWIQEFELWGSASSPDLEEMDWLGTFSLDQVGKDQGFTFEPVELRYIALVPTSNYGGTEYALNEFEVYEAGSLPPLVEASAPPQATAPEVPDSDRGAERPPSQPDKAINIQTDFAPRPLARGASASDNIEYEIEYSDLVPVIYHLYGDYFDDLAATTLTNHNPGPVTIRVEATVPNYTDTAVTTLTLDSGESVRVAQNPPLLPQALDLLHGMREATLHIRVDLLEGGAQRLVYEGTESLTIYSRDDFPWGIPGYHNGTIFLATMVTPNDPALDDLLRAAAEYAPGGIMRWGYSDEYDSDHRAWETMKAIYRAVAEDYDVTYVATGLPFVPREEKTEGFWMQRIKLPYEVLETRSGMCVELSLLFASAFEKMYLRPILISLPGHEYVGIPIHEDSNIYYFLETTLVGRASFEEAVHSANESFMNDELPYIEADRLDSYFWLDVWEAREEGIWPIPWR